METFKQTDSSIFHKQTYKNLWEIGGKKKFGVAGLQPNTFLHDYSKLSN